MYDMPLFSKKPGPNAHQNATVERPDIPNVLNRKFIADAPNQVWCSYITYIWTGNKWAYLAVVLDLYSRRVVIRALFDKPDAKVTIKALEKAYQQSGKLFGLIFHSDQGIKYDTI